MYIPLESLPTVAPNHRRIVPSLVPPPAGHYYCRPVVLRVLFIYDRNIIAIEVFRSICTRLSLLAYITPNAINDLVVSHKRAPLVSRL